MAQWPPTWPTFPGSLWTDPSALRAFVALPAHREIVRRYRDRGTTEVQFWDDPYDLRAIWRKAYALLLDPSG